MDWTKIIEIVVLIRHIVDDIRGELDDEDPGVIDWDDLITLVGEKNLGEDVVKLVGLIVGIFADMTPKDRVLARDLLVEMTAILDD